MKRRCPPQRSVRRLAESHRVLDFPRVPLAPRRRHPRNYQFTYGLAEWKSARQRHQHRRLPDPARRLQLGFACLLPDAELPELKHEQLSGHWRGERNASSASARSHGTARRHGPHRSAGDRQHPTAGRRRSGGGAPQGQPISLPRHGKRRAQEPDDPRTGPPERVRSPAAEPGFALPADCLRRH